MKECSKCHLNKSEDNFYKLSNGSARLYCKSCQNIQNKIWRDNHPNINKERYAKEKDILLARGKKWRQSHKEIIRKTRLLKYANNLPLVLLRAAKNRAKIKKLEFSITLTDIQIPNICPVLGITIFYKQTGSQPNPNSPSIDRIDNSKGYTSDNIIVISRRANVLKNDATMDELRKIISFYDNFSN